MSKELESLKVDRLSPEIYLAGLKSLPILTVDFVLQRPDGKILLAIRNEGAYVGEWFCFGGRLERGESDTEALLRVASREVGLTRFEYIKTTFVCFQHVYNPPGRNVDGPLPAYHSVWHFYVIQVRQNFEPRLDKTSETSDWFNPMFPMKLPEPVYKALLMAIIEGKLLRGTDRA